MAGLVVCARDLGCRDTSGVDKADQLGQVIADALLRMDPTTKAVE